jgi:chromosome partitioning protein
VNGREDILRRAVEEVADQYDYIIVDCPPNIGLLTFNALRACSEAIVPMDPSFFSLHGIGKTLETFEVLRKETGHHVEPRVLITLYYGRTPFVKAVLEDIRSHLPGMHYQTVIRYSVKLAEAASHGLPIAQYCRYCAGFEDYRSLSEEILQQEIRPGAEAQTAEGEPTTEPDSIQVALSANEAVWN